MKAYTWWFDLPLYSLVPFITERLELETDFENEARNSERMRELVNGEPSLRGRVYVPPVYPELSSKRVLTTEWIEGVRLWDKEALTAPWINGWGRGSMGVHGTPLEAPDMEAIRRKLRENPRGGNGLLIKPERTEWRGRRGRGGLGVSTKEVMTTMIDLFGAQIFKWGVVHCDPRMFTPFSLSFSRPQQDGADKIALQIRVTSSSAGSPTASRNWSSSTTGCTST